MAFLRGQRLKPYDVEYHIMFYRHHGFELLMLSALALFANGIRLGTAVRKTVTVAVLLASSRMV